MNQTVQRLLTPNKGILAADGTNGIIKRFESAGLTFTPELDVKYKTILFTTNGLENYISGVILNDKNIKEDLGEILKQKGIESSYYEAWTNIISGIATVWKCNFKKSDYIGTVLLAEDVIWLGRSVNAVLRMLHEMKKKKVYVAVILDYNRKADFSIFN